MEPRERYKQQLYLEGEASALKFQPRDGEKLKPRKGGLLLASILQGIILCVTLFYATSLFSFAAHQIVALWITFFLVNIFCFIAMRVLSKNIIHRNRRLMYIWGMFVLVVVVLFGSMMVIGSGWPFVILVLIWGGAILLGAGMYWLAGGKWR